MALHIRDAETDELVRKLATARGVGLTQAVRDAVQNELARVTPKKSLAERLKPIFDEIDALPRTGLQADKAFYDELWGQEEDGCS